MEIQPLGKQDGREVKSYATNINGEIHIVTNEDKKMYFEEDYRGEYSIGWIVMFENGVETGRANVKYMLGFEWELTLDELTKKEG